MKIIENPTPKKNKETLIIQLIEKTEKNIANNKKEESNKNNIIIKEKNKTNQKMNSKHLNNKYFQNIDKNLKHEYKSNQNHLLRTLQAFLYHLINCKAEQE